MSQQDTSGTVLRTAPFSLQNNISKNQGTVIKRISDTHVSEGSGGQEPDMDFLCGYLTFYLAILGGYCIQYIRTHFRTIYSTDDNTVQSVLYPVLPRVRGFKKLNYTLNSG